MKKFRAVFIPVIFIFISFLVAGPGDNQKAEWKGKVKNEDGIKVIKNPGEPLYGEIEFELKVDLKKKFNEVWNFEVDSEGNIYVIEKDSWIVKVFNPRGKQIKKFGGPPKADSGGTVTVTSSFGWRHIRLDEKTGEIYLNETGKIYKYGNDGNFQKNIHYPKFIQDFWVGSDGNIWAKFRKYEEEISNELIQDFISLVIIPTQGGTVKEIYVYPDSKTHIVTGRRAGRITSGGAYWHGYEYNLCLSHLYDDSFVYGYSKEYELNMLNKNGDLLYKIKKDEPAQRFTQEEKQKVLSSQFSQVRKKRRDLIMFPETRSFYDSILTDDKGRIFVQRVQSPLAREKKYDSDIFSKNGYYIYKTTFPHEPHVIRNGYFYTHIVDKNAGTSTIKRYRIKNWDQIRIEADIQSD